MSKSPLITISVRAGSSATVSVTASAPTVSVRTRPRPDVTDESSASVAPSSSEMAFAEKSVYVPGAEAYAAIVFAPLTVSVPGTCTVGMLPFQTIEESEMVASCASSDVANTMTSFVEAAVWAEARSM